MIRSGIAVGRWASASGTAFGISLCSWPGPSCPRAGAAKADMSKRPTIGRGRDGAARVVMVVDLQGWIMGSPAEHARGGPRADLPDQGEDFGLERGVAADRRVELPQGGQRTAAA